MSKECKTCGDSGRIPTFDQASQTADAEPCPDCQQSNSEFIEGARALLRQGANDAQWELATLLRKACDRLDTAAQQRKDLLDALKELAATFVGLVEGSIGGQAMKKANEAIDNFER